MVTDHSYTGDILHIKYIFYIFFYRWHGHMEDLMQEYRDLRLPS